MPITIGSIAFDGERREYEVIEFLGSGNFGHVYKIKRKFDNTFFALKTLPTIFATHNTLKAFKNEGQLATEITNPNVIKYYFFHDGEMYPDIQPYIIMEFAGGGTLEKLIAQSRKDHHFLTNETLVRGFQQLIAGMEAINSRLVHRDIKPDNILISGDQLKITDFGLSKVVQEATRTSTFKGFGCLMSLAPEGWKSEKNTPQMDIYSMGLVFYELATLKYPYTVNGADPHLWMDAHLFQVIQRPERINPALSPAISQTIMGMLEKRTQDRFKDWNAVKNVLSSENRPATGDSALIDKALRKRLDEDAALKAQQLDVEKKKEERRVFIKLIEAQFNTSIIEPLQIFVDEFNSRYSASKVNLFQNIPMSFYISTPSGSRIEITVHPLLEESFWKEWDDNSGGRPFRRREIVIPKLKGTKILAWGYIRAGDGRGVNLILTEHTGELYGDWSVLHNKMGAFAVGSPIQKPEPFAFDFDELEYQVRVVDAIREYYTQVRSLDVNFIKEFVSQYF